MAQQHINLGTPPNGSDGDTNRTAWGKTEANFNEVFAAQSGLISGLGMEWLSATSLRVAAGVAHVPSLAASLTLPAAIAKSGLSLAANSWHHLYVYWNGTAADIEISTTAPAAPYSGTARTKSGDTSKRYVGSVRTGAGGAILPFLQQGTTIAYLYDVVGTGRVLSAGTATANTAVSLSALVPPTSRLASLSITNGAPAQSLFTRSPDQALSGGVIGRFLFMAVRAASMANCLHPISAAQAVEYSFNATPAADGGYIDVNGYVFER